MPVARIMAYVGFLAVHTCTQRLVWQQWHLAPTGYRQHTCAETFDTHHVGLVEDDGVGEVVHARLHQTWQHSARLIRLYVAFVQCLANMPLYSSVGHQVCSGTEKQVPCYQRRKHYQVLVQWLHFSEYLFYSLTLPVEDNFISHLLAFQGGIDGCLGRDGEIYIVTHHKLAGTYAQ